MPQAIFIAWGLSDCIRLPSIWPPFPVSWTWAQGVSVWHLTLLSPAEELRASLHQSKIPSFICYSQQKRKENLYWKPSTKNLHLTPLHTKDPGSLYSIIARQENHLSSPLTVFSIYRKLLLFQYWPNKYTFQTFIKEHISPFCIKSYTDILCICFCLPG